MSDTPRTDAFAEAIDWSGGDYSGYAAMLGHSRQLERENRELLEALKELFEESVHYGRPSVPSMEMAEAIIVKAEGRKEEG